MIDADSIACTVVGTAALAGLVALIIRDGNENEADKRRALARRFCEKCGYDVHAGHDRCPECGHVIPPPKSAP